jgi:hypothetical protein
MINTIRLGTEDDVKQLCKCLPDQLNIDMETEPHCHQTPLYYAMMTLGDPVKVKILFEGGARECSIIRGEGGGRTREYVGYEGPLET